MKATLLLLAPVALLTSCTTNQGQVGAPVAPAANTGNQYGVPGAPGVNVPTAPPYQQVDPINPPAPSYPSVPSVPTYTPPPVTSTPAPTTLNGNVHTISKGDSLWGISRKYGTSVDAIKSANGLESDTIIEGRTLVIPGR